MPEKIQGDEVTVYGSTVDNETRCKHYHTELDIIAIKFRCCSRFYPCYKCHEESEKHPVIRWEQNQFNEAAILCGHCKNLLTIKEYMGAKTCKYCGAAFNSRCKAHYHIYFEVPEEEACSLKDN